MTYIVVIHGGYIYMLTLTSCTALPLLINELNQALVNVINSEAFC